MKRRFPGYLVQESWFGRDPSFQHWEPNRARALRSAEYLVRHHRCREDPRFWVNVGILNIRTGRYETCC